VRHVEALKSGRHKVRFRHGGKQTSETFDNARDARQFAKWLDALGPQGALDKLYEGERDADVPTLDELAADHFEHLPGIERGTRLTYERLWARTWSPLIGSLPAHRVGPDDVRRAVNVLAGRYSAKSLLNQRGLLSGVLGRAIEKGYLAKNPAKGIRLARGRESERVEMRILTPEEFDGVLDRTPEHYHPLVRFLFGTGARWGEAVALQVGDVALPNVRIRRALKWSPDNDRQVGATKTRKSNRTVMVGLAGELPDDLRAQTAGKARTDLVFTAPRGGPILHRTFWSRVWLPAVEHLEPRPRIHDLRHSHASWLLGNGVPIHVVQARLGHETIQTTVDTYSHLLPDAQIAAANAARLALG
jgi:integrase